MYIQGNVLLIVIKQNLNYNNFIHKLNKSYNLIRSLINYDVVENRSMPNSPWGLRF